ncbi:hypothetical protein D3C87_2102220 [compost metagenome]
MQNVDRFENCFRIIQRFTHAHEDDIGDTLTFFKTVMHLHELADDLFCAQTTL